MSRLSKLIDNRPPSGKCRDAAARLLTADILFARILNAGLKKIVDIRGKIDFETLQIRARHLLRLFRRNGRLSVYVNIAEKRTRSHHDLFISVHHQTDAAVDNVNAVESLLETQKIAAESRAFD